MRTCIQFMSDDKDTINNLYRRYADERMELSTTTELLIEGHGLTQQVFPDDFVNRLTDTNIYFIRMQD